MKRVLFVGQEPETVDFSDPSLPSGLTAAKIHAGIAAAMEQMAACGWHADLCLFRSAASARRVVKRQLLAAPYDCVVIGEGVRIPVNSLVLFEAPINTIHQCAPSTFIAFNTKPEDTDAAAARWIDDN